MISLWCKETLYRARFPCRSGIRSISSVSLEADKEKYMASSDRVVQANPHFCGCSNWMEKPDDGEVVVNGQHLTQMNERTLRLARRSIWGTVPSKHFNLVSNRTVSGNVCMPLELAGMSRTQRVERGLEVLRFVGLGRQGRSISCSSLAEEQQRVAIARALASRPDVLLCDEPTSSLYPQTTNVFWDVLRHINETLGVTIVVVTHEMEVARR